MLSTTQNLLCNRLVNKYNKIIVPVKKISNLFSNSVSTVVDMLSGMSFSPSIDIYNELDKIEDYTNKILPQIDSNTFDEIKDFVSQCNVLSSNPLTEIQGINVDLLANIDQFVSDSTSSEFGPARIILDLINKLEGDDGTTENILSLIQKANGIINCLSNLCGISYSSLTSMLISDLDSLCSTMSLISDVADPDYGKLDLNSIYARAGLTSANISNMNIIITRVLSIKKSAQNQVVQLQNTIKSILKSKVQVEVPRSNHGIVLEYDI